MLQSVQTRAQEAIKELFGIIRAQGDTDYIGEQVSQLEHSLQCAHLATQDSTFCRDEEVILAALLHDIGRFIPAADRMPKMVAADGSYVGRCSHDILGEHFLRMLRFSDKISQLVGAHVMAKRYLTAVDSTYYDGLSQTSKRTLQYQGGIFTEQQVNDARTDPLLSAKLAVRRWDDEAKDPNKEVPRLEAYYYMAVRCISASRSTFKCRAKSYKTPTHPTIIILMPQLDLHHLQTTGCSNKLTATKSRLEDGVFIFGNNDHTSVESSAETVQPETKQLLLSDISEEMRAIGVTVLRCSVLPEDVVSQPSDTAGHSADVSSFTSFHGSVQCVLKGQTDVLFLDCAAFQACGYPERLEVLDCLLAKLLAPHVVLAISAGWDEETV